MSTWAIILAAGNGSRLASATNGIGKQFLDWQGRPLYWHSALAMSRATCIDGIVFVFPEENIDSEKRRIQQLAFMDNLGLEWKLAAGGQRRQDSAKQGLSKLPMNCDRVLIHDAARCFVSPALIRNVASEISEDKPSIVPAVKVIDTIRLAKADSPNRAEGCLPRDRLRAIQTPQGFLTKKLREAYMNMGNQNVTDDAALLEKIGIASVFVEGDPANIKITRPEDLKLLKHEERLIPCSGFGYDVHRYGGNRPLKLGGVEIPCSYEVIAHSDGDVLMHSLIDALLGCAGLGDIGNHFPDSDSRYEAISSTIMLKHTLDLLSEACVRICHVDMTVVAQKPHLAKYGTHIKRNVARLLDLPQEAVNFKATTEEGLGFTGNCEGIKAYSLVNGLRELKGGTKQAATPE